MAYEEYEKRRAGIDKWFDEYIRNTFVSLKHFGHLMEYHVNKSDEFLKNRCAKEHIHASTFIGNEADILKMLQEALLEEREELIDYLADAEDIDVWEISGQLVENVSGHAFMNSINHNWSEGAIICNEFKISFKKNPHNLNALVITSAYPF